MHHLRLLKLLNFLFIGSFILGWNIAHATQTIQSDWTAEISAKGWIIVDFNTGEILAGNNMHKRLYPASITKIVTAIMAIEQKSLDEIVIVSQTADDTIGSSLYLEKGDRINLKDLLYGIMLHSGNDGAVAVAESVAGTESKFAQQMTAFVQSIGAKDTQLLNASGLPDDEHYTTAYDMSVITRYAMKNPVFREIVAQKSYNWSPNLWRPELSNHEKEDAKHFAIPWTENVQIINHNNRLLTQYNGTTGIKNGFTSEARYTLVGTAKRKETELIAVILKSDNADSAYKDIAKILDYGFSISKDIKPADELTEVISQTKLETAKPISPETNKIKVQEPKEIVLEPKKMTGGNSRLWERLLPYILTGGLIVIGLIFLVIGFILRKKS